MLEKASEEVGTVFLPTPDTLVLGSIHWIPDNSTCHLTNCLIQVEVMVALAMMASFCCLLNEK